MLKKIAGSFLGWQWVWELIAPPCRKAVRVLLLLLLLHLLLLLLLLLLLRLLIAILFEKKLSNTFRGLRPCRLICGPNNTRFTHNYKLPASCSMTFIITCTYLLNYESLQALVFIKAPDD